MELAVIMLRLLQQAQALQLLGLMLRATKTIAHNTTGAASVDNSDGNVIQDLTIDVNGHVTATGTEDLDTVYYTQTEINSQLGGDPATDTTDRLLYGYSSVAARNANASKCIWITTELQVALRLATFGLTLTRGDLYAVN